MKTTITVLLIIACSLLGAFAATLAKPAPATSYPAEATSSEDYPAQTREDEAVEDELADDGYGSSDSMYYKFSREFVVPIMRNGDLQSLVIINLNIEADSSISDTLFRMEPKLRDNIMTSLIELSQSTDALQNFAEVQNYETIRSTVLYGLQELVTDGITSVLIVDIGRQNL